MTPIENNVTIKSKTLTEWSCTMIKNNNKSLNLVIELLLIFSVYLIIGRLLIHSGDDWAWGGEIGIQRLQTGFDNYNGRYIGNIIEMIITRNMFLRLFFYAGINTGIIFLSYKLLDKKFLPRYYFLALLLIPIDIYKQTFGWLAGFANYNVSTFFILLVFYLVIKCESNLTSTILISISAFISQFFVENVSIANVLLAAIGLIIALRNKEKIISCLAWLAGASLGLILMFMNTAYHAQDNMRGISNVNINNFTNTLLTSWSELFVKENALLLVAFSIVIYFLNNKKGFLAFLPIPIATYFAIRYLFNISYPTQSILTLAVELIFILVFLFTLIFTVFKSSEITSKSKSIFYFYLFSAVILLGPFLVLTPFGPRNILTSYVLLVLCLFELLSSARIPMPSSKIISLLTITLSIVFISLHLTNKIAENKRITALKNDVSNGMTEVVFERLPYEFLGHDLTPLDGSVQSNRQKMYHNIPKEVKFKITEYKASSRLKR